jgi:putative endonuclease
MTYFAYILICKDGTLYIGSTNDLEKRLYGHNNLKSGAHYTKVRRPVHLAYKEGFETFSEAKKREAELKKWTRSQKLNLIKTGTTS